MPKVCTIHTLPRITDQALAAALVGRTIPIRPELLAWTEEPASSFDRTRIYLHNADVLAVLTAALGIGKATDFCLLQLRTTSIPRECCTISEIEAVASSC